NAQDLAPDIMNMSGMMQGKEVPTHIFILILSGIIMILTLWFSKRAKKVIKTTVSLSSQSTEEERFTSTPLSRSIVRMCVGLSEIVHKYTPKPFARLVASRFKQEKRLKMKGDTQAFDLVRASVNLMVASTLIAFGTSLQLPLSTTYITFMVAMGTSLSDGAWGRENAVYRVTGVFTVIGGWFVTAIVAFTIACVVAFIIYFGSWIAIVGILGILVFTVLRTHTLAKRKDKIQEEEASYLSGEVEAKDIHQAISDDVSHVLSQIPLIYELTIDGLDEESLKTLRKAQKEYEILDKHTKSMKNKVNETIQIIQEGSLANSHFYIQLVNYLRETIHSLSFVVDAALEHTSNKHKGLLKDQINELRQNAAGLDELYKHLIYMIHLQNYDQVDELTIEQQHLSELLDSFNKKQMKRVKNGISGTKNSLLFLRLISNSKNMIMFTYLLSKSLRDFEAAKIPEPEDLI
ncbi:MAG: inorganic phosphate transporter, partial [Bacteroidales bacterium]